MKLEKVLDLTNTLEKNSFVKILDNLISSNTKNKKEIEKILSSRDSGGVKSLENNAISQVFMLLEDDFLELIEEEFLKTSSQLDILIDVITRDGNCIMKRDWFSQLYEAEIKGIKARVKNLTASIEDEKSDLSVNKRRDFKIYKACLHTAYFNDTDNNRDAVITSDELSILHTLSDQLGLFQEEVKLINYMVVPVQRQEIEKVVNDLKNLGVIFFAKKSNTIYVADEIVVMLRKLRGKVVADKYFRRVLKMLSEAQINLICKTHNLDWKAAYDIKVNSIVSEGLSFRQVLTEDVFKETVSITDRKKFLNELWEKGFAESTSLKGATLDEKVDSIIEYFSEQEKDENVSISVDGYTKLLADLQDFHKGLNGLLKKDFEIQEENALQSKFLLDFNIKPRDILDLLPSDLLKDFCKAKELKVRGNVVQNILEGYKDSENLYIENYEAIGYRDLATLKANGINLKESELGLKFEDVTKSIFEQLGFNVDEQLKKKFNTNKDKIDVLLNVGNNELILVECKTVKESGYNKFSSVSRQLKAYNNLCKGNGFKVIKSLLVAPEFSDDFVNETELEYELNLSLINASSLAQILTAFKEVEKHEQFPYKLLLRDVLIKEDRIIKAIKK